MNSLKRKMKAKFPIQEHSNRTQSINHSKPSHSLNSKDKEEDQKMKKRRKRKRKEGKEREKNESEKRACQKSGFFYNSQNAWSLFILCFRGTFTVDFISHFYFFYTSVKNPATCPIIVQEYSGPHFASAPHNPRLLFLGGP